MSGTPLIWKMKQSPGLALHPLHGVGCSFRSVRGKLTRGHSAAAPWLSGSVGVPERWHILAIYHHFIRREYPFKVWGFIKWWSFLPKTVASCPLQYPTQPFDKGGAVSGIVKTYNMWTPVSRNKPQTVVQPFPRCQAVWGRGRGGTTLVLQW